MYNYILILVLAFIFSCSDKIISNNYYNEALKYHDSKNFDKSLIALNFLIDNNPKSDFLPNAYFLISEIYLNEFKEYDISILYLSKLIDAYPEHELSKKALFTLAYINANYIDSYTDAIDLYRDFKNKYPADDLIPSVNYELDNLKDIQQTIEILLNS
jgi:TolA-binding protein